MRARGTQPRKLSCVRFVSIFSCLFFLSISAAQSQDSGEAGSDPAPRKKEGVSRFQKMAVYGENHSIRSGILSIASDLLAELNAITLDKKHQLKIPIIIRLVGELGDAERKRSVVSRIDIVQGQYQLKLFVHLARGVDNEMLRYHIMELLLYERGLANAEQVAEGERVNVPPWLIVGMLEAIDIKAGRSNRKLYQSKKSYFDLLTLQQVFDASEKTWSELEGAKPMAFRVISGGLVNALFRQPKGRPSMAQYLASVATFKGETENLMRQHFPGLNQSKNSLEKWVILEIAELGTARTTDVHSILETEQQLEQILKLRYRDEDGSAQVVDINDFKKVISLQPLDRVEAVASARAEIERLSYRCFPSYRPLLYEYQIILRDIVRGKEGEIDVRLSNLIDERQKKIHAGKRVRDYMDWYYITQSEEVGGNFVDYRQLSDTLAREAARPPADDIVAKYLDQVQRTFGGRPVGRRNSNVSNR